MKLLVIAGARPNFMKVAPLIRELRNHNVLWRIVHTGQHYDDEMSNVFFETLDIPEPDYFLNVGSGTHAEQTSKIMLEFEKVCQDENPDVIVVVGDVNSTLACSITAKKLHIKVAHVEAGLRSGDLTMPEEINRIVTDSIADSLFVTEKSGIENLKKEGKKDHQIFFVGNIMIDNLFYSLKKVTTAQKRDYIKSPYAVITLHRPSNVDDRKKLENILMALQEISQDMNVIFPIHPRTKKNIEMFSLSGLINTNINVTPPRDYIDFLTLWKDATLVLTDSGGIQEETTALGIPCFTIRENTERPVTVEEGTNTLVGTSRQGILNAYNEFKKGDKKTGKVPELWDGRAAKRIVDVLLQKKTVRCFCYILISLHVRIFF